MAHVPERLVKFTPRDTSEDDFSAEIAIACNEAMVGVSLCMGDDYTPRHAVVQSAEEAYRLKAGIVKSELKKCGVFSRLMLL